MFNRALTVLPFFMIGFTFKRMEQRLQNLSPTQYRLMAVALAMLFAGSVLLGFFLFPGKSIDVHMAKYFNLPLCGVQILSGVLLLFVIFSRVSNYPRGTLEIGKDSLVIYMWHPYIIAMLWKALYMSHVSMHYMLSGLIVTLAGILVCCVLTMLIRRFVPFMIGNR